MSLSLWQEECDKKARAQHLWSIENPGLLDHKVHQERKKGNRVCPDEAQSHRNIPLLGINYKALIKHTAKVCVQRWASQCHL